MANKQPNYKRIINCNRCTKEITVNHIAARYCVDCIKLKKKEYYLKNRDIRIKYFKEHRLKDKDKFNQDARVRFRNLKLEILNHYSFGEMRCACCGDNHVEFLSIDHINNDGAEQRKEHGKGASFHYWLKRNNYPEGYQVLCYNCNCSRGFFGYCPHKQNNGTG